MALFCHLQDFGRHTVCAHDDHRRGSLADQVDLRLGIASCNDDPVLDVEFREVLAGDGNYANFSIRSGFRVLVDDPAVDRGAYTLERSILEESRRAVRISHRDVRGVASRDDAQEPSLLIDDTAYLPVILGKDPDRLKQSLVRLDGDRLVESNLPEFESGVLQQHRLLKSEAVKQIFGLSAQFAETARYRLDPVCSLIKCVTYRRSNRICIRMSVACNVYTILLHMRYPPY